MGHAQFCKAHVAVYALTSSKDLRPNHVICSKHQVGCGNACARLHVGLAAVVGKAHGVANVEAIHYKVLVATL